MKQQRLIRFDWAMKRLLRNKANFDILEGFLSELLKEDIIIHQLLESESNQNDKTNKQNRVDLLAENSRKELILIEVQNEEEHDYFQRMLLGTSNIISQYLDKGKAYREIKKVYSVSIVYFDLGQGQDYVYCGKTEFRGIHHNDLLELNDKQIEMFGNKPIHQLYPEYFLIKVNHFDDIAKDSLDEWIYFLKNEDIKPEFRAKGIQKAKKEFDVMDMPKDERRAYQRYLDDLHYAASMHDSSFGLGFIRGKKQGILQEKQKAKTRQERLEKKLKAQQEKLEKKAQKLEKQLQTQQEKFEKEAQKEKEAALLAIKQEIAKKCLQNGMSIDDSSKMSGLSQEDVASLSNNL